MSTFKTPDGTVYRVAEGKEGKVVDMLRRDMWTTFTKREYMERLGDLVAEMYGVCIDTENPVAFLEALVDLKIIDRVKE